MNDIYIRLINLPASVKGVTVVDENEDYNIYINQNLSQEQQMQVYQHEKNHIDNNDFHNFDDIDDIETRAEASAKTGKRPADDDE